MVPAYSVLIRTCPLARSTLLVVAGFHWGTFWLKPGVGWVGPWDSPGGRRTHGPSLGRSSRCHCGQLPTTCRCQHPQSLARSLLACTLEGAWTSHTLPDGLLQAWGSEVFLVCVGSPFGLLELFEFLFPHKESYLGRFVPCFCLSSTSHCFFHLNHTTFFP